MKDGGWAIGATVALAGGTIVYLLLRDIALYVILSGLAICPGFVIYYVFKK